MSLLARPKELRNISKRSFSFPELVELTQAMLNQYTGKSMLDVGLEEALQKNQEEHRRTVSKCIRTCCSGNQGARETVREIIRKYLEENLSLREEDMNRILPFNNPAAMSSWQILETLIYILDKEDEEKGFSLLYSRYGLGKERKGNRYEVTEAELRELYKKIPVQLSFQDGLHILSQLLFASTVGLGIIDTLNHQKGCIEEIQLGMSGRAERGYDYKEEMQRQRNKVLFSRDGVHVLVKGCTIWLRFLSFGTEIELQRVLRNLIKDSQAGELTKNHPMLVVDTVDGRRVSVSRPPMTDAWVGLIRKFDTVREVSLEQLYQGCPEENVLPELLRQLVRSGRNIAITGEMASGKTTLFRACLVETKRELNIRVVEADSFELNVRGFMPEANSMTMRVTEKTPAEEVLAFARKTTGQIFAVGEINSAAVAAMAMDLSKIASQLFFSAHYITTEHMIADFVNAKLCVGGYSEEVLAELDVVRCLGFDVHLKTRQGKRYVQYVNEIVPVRRNEERKGRTYLIHPVYYFDEEAEQGVVLNAPAEITYEKAKQVLGKEEFAKFCSFFGGKEGAEDEGRTDTESGRIL